MDTASQKQDSPVTDVPLAGLPHPTIFEHPHRTAHQQAAVMPKNANGINTQPPAE
jgi:hypothetical protein